MNIEFTDNGNCPPGFIDEAIKVKSGGTRRGKDEDKDFKWSLRNFPTTIKDAETQMNIIRQNPKAYDFENTTGDNKGA